MFKNIVNDIVNGAYWCYGKSKKIFDYVSESENERRFRRLEKMFEEQDTINRKKDKELKQLKKEQKRSAKKITKLKLYYNYFFEKHAIWEKESEINNKTFNASLALESQKRRIKLELEDIKSYRDLKIEHRYELKVTYSDEDGNPVEERYDAQSAEEFLRKNLEEFNENIERLESFEVKFKEEIEKKRNDLEEEYENNLAGLSSDSDNEELPNNNRDRKPSASFSECSVGDGGMMGVE